MCLLDVESWFVFVREAVVLQSLFIGPHVDFDLCHSHLVVFVVFTGVFTIVNCGELKKLLYFVNVLCSIP